MDDPTAYERLKPHMKPYDPAVPLGPHDGLFIEQEDGPPLLYIGGIKHTYTIEQPKGAPVDDLAAIFPFINACLDEDEQTALDATEGPWFADHPQEQWGEQKDAELIGAGKSLAVLHDDDNGHLNVDHIALHHPARVLAEVGAKRRMLKLHSPYVVEPEMGCKGCAGGIPWEACPIIRLLALPYADRPGYKDTWQL